MCVMTGINKQSVHNVQNTTTQVPLHSPLHKAHSSRQALPADRASV